MTSTTRSLLRVVPGTAPEAVMFDPGNFTPYYIDSLCSSLRNLGFRSRVITSPPLFEPVDPAGRYEVEQLFFPWLRGPLQTLMRRRTRLRQLIKAVGYPSGLWRTWQALRGLPPGILHLHWALVPVLDGLLLRVLKRRGWRIVYTAHDPLPGADRPLAHRQYDWMLKPIDALIAHTPNLADALVTAYPQVDGRVHVIPHGGRGQRRISDEDRARARQQLGLEAHRPVLLFFGMLKPYKGIQYLLAAMPKILASAPRARLVIAGEPLMPLGPVLEQIAQLNLGDAVVLRAAFVPQDEVPAYFAVATLLVAPYVDIAASGVVAMAQGYGVPVVVTRVGGLPEFVEPDTCGFVVPPRSADALADAICRALADPEGLAAMGERAWQRIQREHDWPDVARLTLECYRATAGAGPRRGR